MLLQERFNERQEKVKALGSKAAVRQTQMSAAYSLAIEEYIQLIESYRKSDIGGLQLIEQLKKLLNNMLIKKKRPLLGSLPYKNLNYPPKAPDSSVSIVPAYKGGDRTVTDDDLKDTPSAPHSEEIVNQAESLNWNPVQIYEYVKNNIETQWYWGCMKGAEETLRQGSGNDCDQAALLVALLRASGFPSRYVRGVIELEAEDLKNLTNVNNESNIAVFLQKAGIPYNPIIRGAEMAAFELEHIWVESEIPYSNYRGAIIDEHGKIWLGLDTSIKVTGYEYNDAADIFEQSAISDQLSAIRDNYLSVLQTDTPLEYVQSELNSELNAQNSDFTYSDLLQTRSLIPEVLNILPASMQYEQKVITGEYADIPDELIHKVRFTATDSNNSELLNLELRTFKLSNQRITVSYEPETVQDQQIINSYGGLDNTPSYLVRLRPVLLVNGQRQAVAVEGLSMGEGYNLAIELISPNGTEKVESACIAGNLSVIGISAQKVVSGQLSAISEEDNAETLLFKEAMRYMDRWNQAEDELASLLHLSIARPVPTIAVVGGVMDVTYLLDTPHGLEWKGVYVDASIRAISVQQSAVSVGAPLQLQRQKLFMQLSALQGSALEHRVFEDDLGVGSISTAKLLQVAAGNTGAGTDILTIDSTNIDSVLSALSYDDYIKDDIINAVNRGLVITLPATEITFEDWTGLGYIKENPVTGEAGYMLSGMIAGGMSAWGMDRWPETYAEILTHPFSDLPNDDPVSGRFIKKITATDFQMHEVGGLPGSPLQVKVTDSAGQPVKGALVNFRVKAGGGALIADAGAEVESLSVETKFNGIAEVKFKLGTKTGDNPTFMKLKPDDKNYTQLGENIVEAVLASTSTKTLTPFTVFGKPGDPHKIIKAFGEGAMALVNSPAGSLRAMVVDQWEDEDYPGNPVSNVDLTFTASGKESMNQAVTLPSGARGVEFYINKECGNSYPLYGECATEKTKTLKTAYFGALVNTIIGNTVNTKYIVTASAIGVPSIDFTLYSDGYREEGDYLPPGIYIRYLDIVNDKGEPVNAAKAGEKLKAPLTAEIFTLYDAYEMEGPYACEISGSPTNCWRIKASGIVNIQPVTNGTITYTTTEGGGRVVSTENLNNGKYEAAFETGSEPAINIIEAEGEATITVPEVQVDEFTSKAKTEDYETATLPLRDIPLKAGQEVLFLREQPLISSNYGKLIYTVYGVDVELVIDPAITLLSEEGYTLRDTTFIYDILPYDKDNPESESNYKALMADIDLFEIDENNNESWVGYLIGDNTKGEGTAVAVAGSHFDISKKYEAEAVLNRGSDVEVRGERGEIKLVNFYIQKQDPEYPDVKLRWNDYYPALGGKIITVKTTQNSLEGTVITCGILQTTLDAISNINPPPTLTCEPVDQQITGGRIRFRLTGEKLAPRINNDPTTGLDEIEIGLSLQKDGNIYDNVIQATYNVKSNYNTIMKEVLEGEAVFVHDTTFTENHQGKTIGDADNERGLDFVQKMINHIIVSLRTSVNETNIKNTLPVYGYYGDMTKQALEAIINGGADPTGLTLVDTNVSHHIDETGSLNTFKKLANDYTGLAEIDIGKVIDKEILVGLNKSDTDIHPTKLNDEGKSDVGIYELYLDDDWDEDGVSNYVEVENSTTSVQFNPLEIDTNLQILALKDTTSRGYPRLGELVNGDAVTTTDFVADAYRSDGLRIPNRGKGYYYFRSQDTKDTDNYAILSTLRNIEEAGKKWSELHPDLAPLNIDVFPTDGGQSGLDPGGSGGIRFGIGDLSIAGGREFDLDGTLWHNTHQNGLDVDVRYMRKESVGEGSLDLSDIDEYDNYDVNLTKELTSLFAAAGAMEIYVDFKGKAKIFSKKDQTGEEIEGESELVTFSNGATAYVKRVKGHYNHFHVLFSLTSPPVGDIHLTATSTTIPADGTSTVTISSDEIKDSKGWPLLNGTLLTITATNENGQAIGFLPDDENGFYRGKQLSVNSEGKLVFTYKAGTTPGVAAIRVYVGYGKTQPVGLLGEIETILLPNE